MLLGLGHIARRPFIDCRKGVSGAGGQRPLHVHQRRGQACVASAIKVFTNPGSRGKIAEWYTDELELETELVLLDMRRGDHKSDWYLKINPFGKVPAIQDGDVAVFESGAILLHLANKYGRLTPDQLGTAAQWTLFANSTMCEAFFNSGGNRSAMTGLLDTLDKILEGKPYLTGDAFTVSDVAVGSYLLYLPLFFPDLDLTRWQHMWQYMKRLVQRPACPQPYKDVMARAMEAEECKSGSSGGGIGGIMKKMGL